MAYQVDRLYSYTVAHDGGFAPNPFWGMCTLACCKPKIRKSVGERLKAHPEEKIWVVGLSSKHRDKGNDIIFIMQVNCAMNFADYWRKEALPFVGLPDPKHTVLKLYGQETNLFKLGRMPAQVLVDKAGIARFVHYGHSMSDIPKNEELLALGDEINAAADPEPTR